MRFYLSYCFVLGFLLINAQANSLEELKRSLQGQNDDKKKAAILYELSEKADAGEWQNYNEQLLQLAGEKVKGGSDELFWKKYYAGAMGNKALDAGEKGNTQLAKKLNLEALSIRREIKDVDGIANSLNNLGFLCQIEGNLPMALNYLEESLIYHEKTGNKFGEGHTLNNLGYIAGLSGDDSLELYYYRKSLRVREEIADSEGIAQSLNNIGIIYTARSNVSEAARYLRKSLDIRLKIQDTIGISVCYNNLGKVAFVMKDMEAARNFFESAVLLARKINDHEELTVGLRNLSVINYELGNFDLSQKYAEESYTEALLTGGMEYKMDACFQFFRLYKTQKKFELAMRYYEMYIHIRDTLNNEHIQRSSLRLQLKHDYEKKATADSIHVMEEKKIVQAQLKQEQIQRYALYGGLALVGVFAIFMVNRFRVTNKQKKLIEEQKQVVEAQKHLVEEKQKEVLDSIYYARRIQRALITQDTYIHKALTRLLKR